MTNGGAAFGHWDLVIGHSARDGMKRLRFEARSAWGIIGIALLIVGMAASVAAQHAPGGHAPGASPRSEFETGMHAAMVEMGKAMETAPMTGDPDKDFLAMMIPHHEGAVEMARLALVHGRDPLVQRLAEEIIAGQQAEIASMQRRLEILRAGSDPDPGGFPALGGTRGPAPGVPGSH
jgi:hypothetical protein